MISVTTGGMDLLDSKTFLAVGLGETKIVLGKGSEALHFILDFVADKETKESISWETLDDKTLRITLTNWDNVLGTTLVEPVEIGTFTGRRLFILIYVKKAGSTGEIREVTFSAYLGEAV